MISDVLTNKGISRAISGAELGWGVQAYSHFTEFARASGEFLVEDARLFSRTRGLPDPPSKRAWGSVVRKAQRDGVVKQVGYSQVKNPLAHKSNVAVWQAV